MKKLHACLLLLLITLLPALVTAQEADITGNWRGKIDLPGLELEILVDFFRKDGAWKGEIDIPMQQAKDLKLTEIIVEGRDLRFSLPDAPGGATFEGKVSEADDEIKGDFKQMGKSFPLALTLGSRAAIAEEQAKQKKALADFKTLADSLVKKRNVPGAAVCIVHKGEVILSEGFGYADLNGDRKVTPKTMFAIGSSSKAFTAMVLSMLADDGKLDFEEPVRKYLPDFRMYDPFATEHMTTMDLLTHRSGLPRHDMAWYGATASRADLYKRLEHLPPNKSFRSTWQYQNLMYMTAGYLAGKVDRSSWEELVKDRIFGPLGMKESTVSIQEMKKQDDRALAYRYDTDKDIFVKLPYRNIDVIGPAGSINSNAEEMANWLKLHLDEGKFGGKTLVSAASLARMHMPQMVMGRPAGSKEFSEPMYGMGWMIYQYKGHKVVEHGGNIDGFSAGVMMIPDEEFGIVVLTNMNGSRLPTVLSMFAADMLLGLGEKNWDQRMFKGADALAAGEIEVAGDLPVEGTQPSHTLADYAGTYFHPGYGNFEISVVDKALKGRINGLDFDLAHWHYDVFNGHLEQVDQELRITFHTDASGDIVRLSLPLEPTMDDVEFNKRPPARLNDPSFLQKFTGKFKLETSIVSFELSGGDRLQLQAQGQAPLLLIPYRNTEFKLEGVNGFSIEFVLDKKGNCDAVLAKQPGVIVKGTRIKEEAKSDFRDGD